MSRTPVEPSATPGSVTRQDPGDTGRPPAPARTIVEENDKTRKETPAPKAS